MQVLEKKIWLETTGIYQDVPWPPLLVTGVYLLGNGPNAVGLNVPPHELDEPLRILWKVKRTPHRIANIPPFEL